MNVAILNSTLRTIGRPDELEKQLLQAELLVQKRGWRRPPATTLE